MKQAQHYFDTIKDKEQYALISMRLKHGQYTMVSKHDIEQVLLSLCSHLTNEEALFLLEDDYLIFLKQHTPLGVMNWIEEMDDALEDIQFLHAAIGVRFLHQDDAFVYCKKEAILAMQHSKDYPKYTTTYEFFHPELLASLQQQENTYRMLQHALQQQQFQIYLQPKLDLTSSTLAGAEALLRLHIDQKEVPLSSFLPLANANAFIRELDLYVLEEVCRFLKHCQTQKITLLPISINISPSSYMDGKNYTARVHSIVEAYGIDPHLLEFELSENIALQDNTFLYTFLNDLQLHGHAISLDDFGAGYSSLLLLSNLKIDTIKLDQQFFQQPFHDRKQRLLLSMSALLHDLGYQVLAEGIETEPIFHFIKDHCDAMQGYYYHPPLSIEAYLALLTEHETHLAIRHLEKKEDEISL